MIRASADIADRLRQLLPRGAAWLAPAGSVLHKLLLGTADELARVYARGVDLLNDAHPGSTDELLTQWEIEWASPGPCAASAELTPDERRAALASKVRSIGGQSAAYYIDVAAAMGVNISISAGAVGFIVGVNGPGDVVGTGPGAYHWVVTAPASTSAALRAALECQLSTLRPAHTTISFEYL